MTNLMRIFMAVEVTLCYIPGTLLRYIPFATKTTSKQKRTLFFSYFLVLFLNAIALFFALTDLDTATTFVRLDIIICQFPLVLLNILIIQGYIREHLFTFGVSTTCLYMLLSISSYIPQLFTWMNQWSQYLFGTVLYALFMVLGYFPIRAILRKTVSPFLSMDCRDYWKSIWFIPIFLFLSMFLALPITQSINTLSLLLSRLLSSVSIVAFCYIVATNHKTLMEKQALTEQLDMAKVHYASLQTKVEDTRKMNHDLKHMIILIRHYIDTDDKPGLIEFCDTTEESVLAGSDIPYTGNSAVDGVIYSFKKKAEENNIHFQYKGNLANGNISDMDICVLLGNVLDNAITGCLTINENRNITVVAETEANTLSFIVQNTFDGIVNINSGKIHSRRRENRIGVGLDSMLSICEKYGGSMKTQWDAHTFTVLFILPLEQNT